MAVPAVVMQNTALWETDLTQYPGFLHAVEEQLNSMLTKGVAQTVAELENANVAL
jgi:mannitol-1-phosphate/altronate dehydrogenase